MAMSIISAASNGMSANVFGNQSKFDAYAASVPVGVKMLRDTLEGVYADHAEVQPARPLNSYKEAICWRSPETSEVFATMMWGGVNPHPHVAAQSDPSIKLASALRTHYPYHRVSRVDVAVDMGPEGIFDRAWSVFAAASAKFTRVTGKKIVNDDPEEGDTYYLGRRGGEAFLRLYEKDKQLAKLTGDPVWRAAPYRGTIRIELEVRPQKEFKARAAHLAPDQFWGVTPWTRQIASDILALSPEAISMKPTRIADHERAMKALTAQYGTTLRRHLERCGGSPEAFLDDLLLRLGVGIAEAA